MITTTRGGTTTTSGGASKTGAAIFAASNVRVCFLHLAASSIEQEISFDGGSTWGIWEANTPINLKFGDPVFSQNLLFRPYTDGQTAVAHGWALSEQVR